MDLLPIVNRTGLPPELSGLYGEDESDEEYSDEDDEDSDEEDEEAQEQDAVGRYPPTKEEEAEARRVAEVSVAHTSGLFFVPLSIV